MDVGIVGIIVVGIALVLAVLTLAWSHHKLTVSNEKLVLHVIAFENPYAVDAMQRQLDLDHRVRMQDAQQKRDLLSNMPLSGRMNGSYQEEDEGTI